jgi:raffinose/stachyose/melibiose transport system substrate-binding protein
MRKQQQLWRSLHFCLALFVLLAAGGCTAPAPGAPAAGAPVTVSLWLNTTGGSTRADCVQQHVVDPYNAAAGAVRVESTMQANLWDATRTALAGGAGPDIIVTPGPSFAVELAKAGQLLPLDAYASQLGWDQIFAPWALKLGLVDGKLYSLPNEVETLVLYYNKTLFDQHGWTPPKTLDELMVLAEEIAAAGVIPFAHTNAEWRPANEWHVGEMLNHAAGPGQVYLALTGQIPWTAPAFQAAIEQLDAMQQRGWFMGGLDRYYTAPFDESRAALGDGKAAMNIEGTWFLSLINNYFGAAAGNSNEWAAAPVPSQNGDAIFDLGIGSTYAINAATPHPDAAVDFITYFFAPATQAILVTQCGFAPAPVNLDAAALAGIDPRAAAIFAALSDASALNNYGYTTWTFWPPQSQVYLYEEIEKVWAGDISAAEYLQGLDDLFQRELAAGAVPPIPARNTAP